MCFTQITVVVTESPISFGPMNPKARNLRVYTMRNYHTQTQTKYRFFYTKYGQRIIILGKVYGSFDVRKQCKT